MKLLGGHLERLRACFAGLPDPRRGRNRRHAMADVAMAALSVFFMQSPSFLAHQRALAEGRTRSNAHTLFGLARIPCDNHIRQLLDGVPTAHFDDEFHAIAADLDAHGALASMRRLDGRLLVALDGTEFFRSRSIHCPHCATRKRSDGAAKQDCEREAAKRWLQRHGTRCAPLRPVYLGDDLYACQPVCRAMLDSGGDFLLTAKPASHKTLCEYLDGIRPPTRRATAGAGARRRIHRYRWMTDLPIRDGDDALRVNWLEITSARPDGTVTHRGTFVTSLDVDRDNVAELADCARARWKIENETFNVLKQHGYHLKHNFGHGNDTLAGVLVVLNLLAFSLHSACELAETLWQSARRRLGTRRRLFEHLRTVTEYRLFPDWNNLLSLLATGGTAAQPP